MTACDALHEAIRDARRLGLPRALIARLDDAVAALEVIEREKAKRWTRTSS